MTRQQVPEPLQPWVDWVLHKHPQMACPVNYETEDRYCLWPGALRLSADDSGARFTQSVSVLTKSRLTLPGDLQLWPDSVQVNQAAVAVVAENDRPVIDLAPGNHEVSGRFSWARLPDRLQLGTGTGMVELLIDGQATQIERQGGHLRLRNGPGKTTVEAPEDALELKVARLITDGRPVMVTTALTLRVSGQEREITLPDVLLHEATPVRLESRLPARLEADGRLTLQLRPGRWLVRVTARQTGPVTKLDAPVFASQAMPNDVVWPDEEIWAWKSAPDIRVAQVEGPDQIDPRQVELPSGWQGLPAYRMANGQSLQIKTIRRGDPTPEPDQLALKRSLWLDFDGKGFSVQDRISGRLSTTWRLESTEQLMLGQATIDGEPQFITRAANGQSEGVEVRRGQIQLVGDSRIEPEKMTADLQIALPANGWKHDFQSVNAMLHTPPGWQVLAVSGVDKAPGAWLERWTLYDLFLVLVIAIATGRLFGWVWAISSCLLLSMLWHEPMAPHFIWLAVLVPLGLLKVVPGTGRLAQSLRIFHWAAMAALLVIVLPFVVNQARTALHPQLEPTQSVGGRAFETRQDVEQVMADAESAESAVSVQSNRLEAQGKSRSKMLSKGSLTSAPSPARTNKLPLTDPKAMVQTGPGIPDWHWKGTWLEFSGPVLADQIMTITLLSPLHKRIAHALIVLLTGIFLWRLTGLQRGRVRDWTVTPVAMVLLALFMQPLESQAAGFPPDSLLRELEQRLIKPKVAAPRAAIASMHLTPGSAQLDMMLRIDALENTIVPLPADTQRLQPMRVRLNGVSAANRILADERGQIWLWLPAGSHQVEMSLHLPALNQIELALPLVPHKVSVAPSSWRLTGLDANGVPGKQLSLVRARQTNVAAASIPEPIDLPPLLEVQRILRLGLSWEIQTTVRRISPTGVPVSVSVDLLDGEQITSAGLTVRDNRVTARLAARERQTSWVSRLDITPDLTLQATGQRNVVETWQLEAGPIWRVQTSGIAPVHHQDKALKWFPTWKPWPGESVSFAISRPEGVAGQIVTIDNSHMLVTPGLRATDTNLKFSLRSSHGGTHKISLPEAAQLQSVRIDNRTRPVRQNGREVTLPIVPGEQKFQLFWRQPLAMDTVWHGPVVDLGTPSVNARLAVNLPQDRWTLWTSGPRLGPAVLFWGILLVLLALSIALGRLARDRIPLGTISCFLLLIGMSQVTIVAPAIVALWFALTAARPALTEKSSAVVYNLVQVLGLVLTAITLVALLGAAQQGLLEQPDMQISGYASNASRLNWYLDRSQALTPAVNVVSVPLWGYRLLMLLWALWLAWSALNWVRWAWQQYSAHGIWRKSEPDRAPVISPDPSDPPGAPPGSGTASVSSPANSGNQSAPPTGADTAGAQARTREHEADPQAGTRQAGPAPGKPGPAELARLAADALRKDQPPGSGD